MTVLDIRQAARILGGVVSGGRIRCPAPGKGRKNRSLSVKFNSDGTFSATDFSGGDWKCARDHVKAQLGLSDEKPIPVRVSLPTIDIHAMRRKASATEIWARSIPIAGTLAETYLRSRGLSYGGEALRYHPGKRMMVAQITDAVTGEPMGIHRTFLDHEGNRTEKKMLGPAGGGVVRLSDDVDVTMGLALGEGIETAMAAPFRPVWACLSAGNLARFPVLAGVRDQRLWHRIEGVI